MNWFLCQFQGLGFVRSALIFVWHPGPTANSLRSQKNFRFIFGSHTKTCRIVRRISLAVFLFFFGNFRLFSWSSGLNFVQMSSGEKKVAGQGKNWTSKQWQIKAFVMGKKHLRSFKQQSGWSSGATTSSKPPKRNADVKSRDFFKIQNLKC